MNVKPLKKLKLQALDRLNQNQRIELVKHEFNELLKLKDVDGVDEKLEDLLEIEDYLGRKGYYSDVLYARYVTLSDRYLKSEISKSILKTNATNYVIGSLVYDLWESYFILTYLLNIYYDNWICYTYIPMKHQDDDLIFEDTFTIRNENLNDRLDMIIELLYNGVLKGIKALTESKMTNIDSLEDISAQDVELNDEVKKYFQEVLDGVDKLKDDGFILAKELELEINKEVWNEYNEHNNLKHGDDRYIDVDKFEIHNHISYDLENSRLIINEDYIDFDRKEDRMYLLLKPLGFDDD